MKAFGNFMASLLWMFNLIYGFMYLPTSGLKFLNIFVPFAVVYDLVLKIGRLR